MYLWKTLKVFISSTFLDLELERDRLAEAFYNLKKDMAQRYLSLIPYDLRWRERHSEDPIPKWCIEMLQQCQYFIGLLGWRYGWRPDLNEYSQANSEKISVTEMEIRCALARIPKNRRFFCIMAENSHSKELANKETLEDLKSVENLKKKLYEAGETILVYHTPQELPQLLEKELKKRIDIEYPPNIAVSFEQYTYQQALEEIIIQKIRGFIGRIDYLQKLKKFTRDTFEKNSNYLAIVATAGTGKSALLAKFIQDWKQENSQIHLICHFMSMSSDSRELHGLFKHLAEQLQRIRILPETLASDNIELRLQIRQALEQTNIPLVLAIDGIDEVEEEGQNLSWLPAELPNNIKIILTIRPVGNWDILQKYPQLQILELPPLSSIEIESIIEQYTQTHHLNLSISDRQLLIKRAAGNPLYLKVALEEILSSGIAVGQLANSIENLFEQILQRLQKRYGSKMIEDYLGLIAASRAGLAELELQELLSQSQFSDMRQHLVDESLMATTKALDNFLVRRSGLIAFFHPEFERSIKERLGKSGMRNYHKILAQYFKAKGYGYVRTLFELCYQQQFSLQHEDVILTLTDLAFLQAKCIAKMTDDILEDFQRSLYDTEVSIPFNLEILTTSGISVKRKTLELLLKALRLDLAFLRKHPEGLFQTLWNRMYWYDNNESELHYEPVEEEIPPWRLSGSKLYQLAEAWRIQQEKINPKEIWIKTCKPLEVSLDTPLLKVLRQHEGWVTSVIISPDGHFVASASHDQLIRLWDIETGECRKVLSGHKEKITKVVFLNQGKNIVSCSEDGELRLWNVDAQACLVTVRAHEKSIEALAIHPSQPILATGAKDWNIRLWKISEDFLKIDLMCILNGHQNEISALTFDIDGKKIISGSADLSMKIWDINTNICERTILFHKRRIYGLCCSPDGTTFASASRDDTAAIWDINTGKILHHIQKHKWGVLALDFSPDSRKLITASGDKTLCLWDVATGKCLKTFRGHERSVSTVKFAPNGKVFVSGSYDRSIRIWNAESQDCSLLLKGHEEWARTAVFSQDGKFIASGSTDRQIVIWDGNNGQYIKKLSGHAGWVTALAFSPNNTMLVSGGGDNTVRLWDITNAKCVKVFYGHLEPVLSVLFIPNTFWIASASRDKTIRLWNIETGECNQIFKGHQGWVSYIDYHPTLKLLASGSHDTTVRLWNVETGECCQTISTASSEHNELSENELHIRSVAFNQDGTQLIVVSRSKGTTIYDLTTKEVVSQIPYDLDAPQMKAEFYPAIQDLCTTVQSNKNQPLAFFPEMLSSPKISSNGKITGVSQGTYIYLLNVCGIQNKQ